MNWLIVDFGNTRLKWALWDGKRLHSESAVEYRGDPLPQLWQRCWGDLTRPQRVVIVSVTEPQANRSLSAWCNEGWGIPAEFIHSRGQACGVINAYREPSRLGADRWAALIAAHHRFPGQTVCIADCGTATTIDALDSQGHHLGGVILPGLKLMQTSLQSGTAGIDQLPPLRETRDFARDTGSATALGCRYATAGALEQAARKLGKTAESEVICIITGGSAPQLLPHLDGSWQHKPKLVLEGARVLADNNTTSST